MALKIARINIINLACHIHILSRSLASLFAHLEHMVDVKSDFDDKERGRGGFDGAHGVRGWIQSAIVHTEFVNNICQDGYTVYTSSSLLR